MSDSRYEIEALLYQYAERIDLGDFEGLADLFAHARISSGGEAFGPVGRKTVLDVYSRTTRRYEDGTPRTKHVTSNVMIDFGHDGDTAKSRSYFTVFQSLEDFPLQAIIAGRYHDQFERVGGHWRFCEREIFPELMGDLSRHLLIEI